MMKRNRTWMIILIIAFIPLISCSAYPDKSLSLATTGKEALILNSIPTSGHLNLGQLNSTELNRLSLGGPSPNVSPPTAPYNDHGLYWSQPFSLIEGDTLNLTINSDFPVSWFGVDWSTFDVRGVLATTEMDEDGRAFDPQYPAASSRKQGTDGYVLKISYKIRVDTDCVLVIKNLTSDEAKELNVTAALKPSISFKRIALKLPVVRNLVGTEEEYDD